MTETPVDVLARRIDRLERQNRRFKRGVTAIVLGIVAVLLMGQTVAKSPTVEAQKLVLKDKRGKIRAVLGEFSDDERSACSSSTRASGFGPSSGCKRTARRSWLWPTTAGWIA